MDSSDSDQENDTNYAGWKASQERKLRYRELLNQVEDMEESQDRGLKTAEEIGDIIREVNKIEEVNNITLRYQYPEEILLDAMVLSSVSSVLVKCLEAVNVNTSTYVPSEFASGIISFCKEDNEFKTENLLKLLSDAKHIIPQVPEYCFTYGTYDLHNLPKHKQKKERIKHQKEKFEKKEPEKVINLEKEEKGIDEILKVMYDVLTECYKNNNKQPIDYYDYVIDTSSFANTIENMFYCSFLVRDGRASIDFDAKKPCIQPVKRKKLKEFRDDGGVNSQVIYCITSHEWKSFEKEGHLQKFKNKH